MPARFAVVVVFALSFAGCASQSAWRPCGPGYLNNIFIRQHFAGVDQRPACQAHDECYATSGRSRLECDQQFYNNMLDRCACSNYPCLCRMGALRWYMQVRVHGVLGYWKAQRRALSCGGGKCGVAPPETMIGEPTMAEPDGLPPAPEMPGM